MLIINTNHWKSNWKVQNRSYSYSKILISFATLPITDLCKLVDNRTSGPNNTGPASGLVLSQSVQRLGPVLFWKLAVHLKYFAGKKSSDYQANSRKAQQQFLTLLKSRGTAENLSQGRPSYQWRQPYSMLQNIGETAVLPTRLLIQPIGKMLRGHTQIWASTDFWAGR